MTTEKLYPLIKTVVLVALMGAIGLTLVLTGHETHGAAALGAAVGLAYPTKAQVAK